MSKDKGNKNQKKVANNAKVKVESAYKSESKSKATTIDLVELKNAAKPKKT